MIVLKTTPHKCNVLFLMKFIVTIGSFYSLPIRNMTSKPKMYDYFCYVYFNTILIAIL